jgi:AcrR family transcriptional regulator
MQHSAAYHSHCFIKYSMATNPPSIIKSRETVAYATRGQELTQKVEDLRVRRTRKLLQKALVEVTSEKGFADVTVQDIAERAMVNRSTFYRHYLDKYDLLRQYLGELYGLVSSQAGNTSAVPNLNPSADKPPAGLVILLEHMQAHADFYRVMLGNKGDPAFCAQSFREYIERDIHSMLPANVTEPDSNRPPIDMTVSYLLSAGTGAIVWWLEKGQACTPEQMAGWVYQLSMASIRVSLGDGAKATIITGDSIQR